MGINKASPSRRHSNSRSGAHAPENCLENDGGGFGQRKRKIAPPCPTDPQHGAQHISLEMALAVATADFAHAYQISFAKGWSGLFDAAAQIRPLLGISPDAWARACHTMGRKDAALALLIIDANSKRPAGDPFAVERPGGAIRGMIDAASAGKLHLDKFIFAMLGQMQ